MWSIRILRSSVTHKDYSSGNPIHIKIYDDKVIIYNNCQIPSNIEPESLLSGIRSNPHNPLIAGGFFRSGQIEAWSRGIEKMRNGCLADGLPEPEFTIQPNMFSICFKIRNNNIVETPSDEICGVNFGVNFGVNSTRKQIIELMIANPEINMQDIANQLDMTKRNVEYAIRDLKDMGLLERVGSDKKGKWVVKKG